MVNWHLLEFVSPYLERVDDAWARLLLTANRKSHMDCRLVPATMTLNNVKCL